MSFSGKIGVVQPEDALRVMLDAGVRRKEALEAEKAAKKAAKKQQKAVKKAAVPQKRGKSDLDIYRSKHAKKAKVVLDGPVVTQTRIVDPILAQLFNQQRVLKEMKGDHRDQLAECDADIAIRKLFLDEHQKVHPLSDEDEDEDT